MLVNPDRDVERLGDRLETREVRAFDSNEASGSVDLDGLQRNAGTTEALDEAGLADLTFQIIGLTFDGLTFDDFDEAKVALE